MYCKVKVFFFFINESLKTTFLLGKKAGIEITRKLIPQMSEGVVGTRNIPSHYLFAFWLVLSLGMGGIVKLQYVKKTDHVGHALKSTPVNSRVVRTAVLIMVGRSKGFSPSFDGECAPPIAITSLRPRIPKILIIYIFYTSGNIIITSKELNCFIE